MNKIYFESNTFWLLKNVPEEINEPMYAPQVKKEIKACIAAKTKIDNPEVMEIGNLLSPFTHLFNKAKDGSIFDVPDGVEFEERIFSVKVWSNGVFNITSTPDSKSGKFGRSLNETKIEKVIHLKLKEEAKPVESQYDLWTEVITYICNKSGSVSELKYNFTITRNKDKNVGN